MVDVVFDENRNLLHTTFSIYYYDLRPQMNRIKNHVQSMISVPGQATLQNGWLLFS